MTALIARIRLRKQGAAVTTEQRGALATTAPRGVGAREASVRTESNPLRRAVRILGPGLVAGASDDDPSGVGTYAVAGASLGFATLWTMLISLPMMAATQYISAKIGMVTGRGLAGVLHRHYPRAVVYPAIVTLAIANTVNAGADLGAIAAALNLLLPVPVVVMIGTSTSARPSRTWSHTSSS